MADASVETVETGVDAPVSTGVASVADDVGSGEASRPTGMLS
jgi:hypothetical protein